MDFLRSQLEKKTGGGAGDDHHDQPPATEKQGGHKPSGASSLFSDAKVVAEAAKSSFGGGSDKVDTGKAAGAAANLLDAASHYGKLDEKGLGKYVDKAEEYLHQHHGSHSSAATTNVGSGGHAGAPAEKHSATAPPHGEHGGAAEGGSESKLGDYANMAERFLKH